MFNQPIKILRNFTAASTRTFTVTGFTLPVAMVHTGDTALRARLSNIASSRGTVQAL
ncbi:hypothetical protein KIN20_031854 [Parelaphostrongylus tenuis]|uniref:Uncharacterized protein n=1 Tax=Parelaphostrongylus tenuis TaxID=148309 RepID=A0AAD5R7N3_PARTN|nr:hypothetical protein KIN20_031854 [Parelaphostrongylus tenuis]